MSESPERIWIAEFEYGIRDNGRWEDEADAIPFSIEYIRADVTPEQPAMSEEVKTAAITLANYAVEIAGNISDDEYGDLANMQDILYAYLDSIDSNTERRESHVPYMQYDAR